MKKEIYDISKKYLENVKSILPQLEREILLEFTRYMSQERNKNSSPPVVVFSDGVLIANLKGPELFGITNHPRLHSGEWIYIPDYFTNEVTLSILGKIGIPSIPYLNIPSTKKLIELYEEG